MKEHGLLKAVTGDAIIFCKDKEIFNAGLMGICKVPLKLNAILIAGCGLVNGVKPVILKDFTCFNAVSHNPFKFHFHYRYTVHTPFYSFQILNQLFRIIILHGCLDFGSNNKFLSSQCVFKFHSSPPFMAVRELGPLFELQ